MASYGYENAMEVYGEPHAMHDYYDQPQYTVAEDPHVYPPHAPSPMYHEVHEQQQHPASASVLAPRPVRCTGSPTFLSPEERMGAFAMPAEAQGVQGMQGMQPNSMLINLAAAAEPAPQIALPQLPPMPPADPALEEAAVPME